MCIRDRHKGLYADGVSESPLPLLTSPSLCTFLRLGKYPTPRHLEKIPPRSPSVGICFLLKYLLRVINNLKLLYPATSDVNLFYFTNSCIFWLREYIIYNTFIRLLNFTSNRNLYNLPCTLKVK